jgi:Tat protein secretion system quality control protein TatD with DNase activity
MEGAASSEILLDKDFGQILFKYLFLLFCMARFVDTHCNIPNILQKFKLYPSAENFTKFSKEHFPTQFESCISVSSDSESHSDTLQIISTTTNIFGAFGIHPLYAGEI